MDITPICMRTDIDQNHLNDILSRTDPQSVRFYDERIFVERRNPRAFPPPIVAVLDDGALRILSGGDVIAAYLKHFHATVPCIRVPTTEIELYAPLNWSGE